MTTRHRSSKHASPFRSRSDHDAAPSCSLQARLPTTGDRRGRGDDRHGRTDSRARIAAQCVKRPASHFLQPQRRPVRRHALDAAQAMGAMPLRPLWRARARSLMPSSRNPLTIRDVRPGRLPPAGYRHRASHTPPMTPPRMASATAALCAPLATFCETSQSNNWPDDRHLRSPPPRLFSSSLPRVFLPHSKPVPTPFSVQVAQRAHEV